MMTLVLGGARSGKSRYAQSLCASAPHVVYVATAAVERDPEMTRRIERHRSERPSEWTTVEAPVDLADAVRRAEPTDAWILVDCTTVWLSNVMHRHRGLRPSARERRVHESVTSWIDAASTREIIVVSNEVGAGIVPENALAREFRDLHGLMNQRLAEEASRVVWMVAGIPVTVKPT